MIASRSPVTSPVKSPSALPPPSCPQLVEPGIDLMAHLLLQRLTVQRGALAVGIKQVAISLLQRQLPLAVLITTEGPRSETDPVMDNLRTMCTALCVPIIFALSRRHMGEAVRAPCGVSAVAVCRAPDERSRVLLSGLAARAERAVRQWVAAASAPAGEPPAAAADRPPWQLVPSGL